MGGGGSYCNTKCFSSSYSVRTRTALQGFFEYFTLEDATPDMNDIEFRWDYVFGH